MKKILSILGTMTLCGTTSINVVACDTTSESNLNPTPSEITPEQIKTELKSTQVTYKNGIGINDPLDFSVFNKNLIIKDEKHENVIVDSSTNGWKSNWFQPQWIANHFLDSDYEITISNTLDYIKEIIPWLQKQLQILNSNFKSQDLRFEVVFGYPNNRVSKMVIDNSILHLTPTMIANKDYTKFSVHEKEHYFLVLTELKYNVSIDFQPNDQDLSIERTYKITN